MNPGFQLLSIRRKREKFYLVVNTIPIGFVTAETLANFQKFLERENATAPPDFWEIHFPRLEQDDETHDVIRAIGIEVEAEREACAHIIDLAVEVANGEGNVRDAAFLAPLAQMIRDRSKATGLESTEIYKALAEAATQGEKRGQAWGLWQAFEYSAQIAEQAQYGELGATIGAEIRKDGAAHDANEWARVVLRAEVKGQTRGAELERESIAQMIETPEGVEGAPRNWALRRHLAAKIRERSPRPPGSYPFTEREIAAHILQSIGDELWGIGRRNQPPLGGELKAIALVMRIWARKLKAGGLFVLESLKTPFKTESEVTTDGEENNEG